MLTEEIARCDSTAVDNRASTAKLDPYASSTSSRSRSDHGSKRLGTRIRKHLLDKFASQVSRMLRRLRCHGLVGRPNLQVRRRGAP